MCSLKIPFFNIGSAAENAACRAVFYSVMVKRDPSMDKLSICILLGETAYAVTPYRGYGLRYNKGVSMFEEMKAELRAKDLLYDFNLQLEKNSLVC